MKTLASILSKTVVRSFYKEYALFFLIGLYLCFGFLRSDDHVALNTLVVSSDYLIGFYYILWTLYNWLIINFFTKHIRSKENTFLYLSRLAPKASLIASLIIMHIYLLAPILAYAVFAMGIAANLGFYLPIFYTILFLAISIIYPIFIYQNILSKPDTGQVSTGLFRINIKIKKPYFSFFFFHLLENEWLKLLISKGISAVILLGLVNILQTDNSDIRPLLIVVLMGFLPNFTQAGSYHTFENVSLLYFKNMPVYLKNRWAQAIGTFAILLIPELFMLYRYAWEALPFYAPFLAYILGVSLLSLYYSGLYLKIAAEERFSNLILIAAIVCFVAILFRIDVLIISATVLSVATFTFYRQYYKYDFIVKKE